jgi:assimilatory nitrate reductase catalytic subunit
MPLLIRCFPLLSAAYPELSSEKLSLYYFLFGNPAFQAHNRLSQPCRKHGDIQWVASQPERFSNEHGLIIMPVAPDGVPTDWQLLGELARRLGKGDYFPYTSPRQIFDELRHASRGGIADYYGITYEKIEAQKGVFWPCPSLDHPGTPRLFEDRFYHADGKALMHAVHYVPPAEEPDEAYPLRYTTGRVVYHFLSGNQTRRIPMLRDLAPDPYVEIHPVTAQKYGIKPGDYVRVSSRRGRLVVRAQISAVTRPDTVFIPYHWGDDQAANLLTVQALDPYSRMPELKAAAVQIARADPPESADMRITPYEGSEGGAGLAEGHGD